MCEFPSLKNDPAYLNKRKLQENLHIDGAFAFLSDHKSEQEALQQPKGKMSTKLNKVVVHSNCFSEVQVTWLKVMRQSYLWNMKHDHLATFSYVFFYCCVAHVIRGVCKYIRVAK